MSSLDAAARAEVGRVFAADAPVRLLRLAAALEDLAAGGGSSLDSARHEAHALRGAAAIVGRTDLGRLCESIEELLAAEPREPDELRDAARRVHDLAQRLAEPELEMPRRHERLLPQRFMAQFTLILTLALVPAFGISIYDTIHGRRDAHSRIAREAQADAQLAAEAEAQLLDRGRDLLLALSQSREIRRGDMRSCSALLARYAARFYPFTRFGVTDGKGRVLCSSIALPPGYSAVLLPSFRLVRSTGRFGAGPLQRDPVGGARVVLIGLPLSGGTLEGGQVDAVLSVAGLQRLIDRVRLPAGSSMTMFDRYGFILARRPARSRFVGVKANADEIRALDAVAGTSETKGIDGVRRVFAYHAAGPWYVSVGIPTAPAYASLTHELVLRATPDWGARLDRAGAGACRRPGAHSVARSHRLPPLRAGFRAAIFLPVPARSRAGASSVSSPRRSTRWRKRSRSGPRSANARASTSCASRETSKDASRAERRPSRRLVRGRSGEPRARPL